MNDDDPRRRQRIEARTRPAGEKKARAPYIDQRDRYRPHDVDNSDFDPPTNPRGRKLVEMAPLSEPEPPSRRPSQDSFQPVPVPPRSIRPPLSLWARAWVTAAVIIAVGGGAIGVVRSLRSKSIGSGAAQDNSARIPAAAPAVAASEPKAPPAPAAPLSSESPPSAISPIAASALPTAVPPGGAFAWSGTSAQRAALSRATSMPSGSSPPRPGKSETATNWRPVAAEGEEVDPPRPAAAASASPAASGASEAWVTEERRF